MKPVSTVRRLAVEALETRTLLAGDLSDPFGLVADLNTVKGAISGTDFSATFSTNWGNRQLVLTGTSASTVTIDLDKLPSFVTNLKITGFAEVKLTGTDEVNNLILDDITSFIAPALSVAKGTTANDVVTLEVGSLGETAILNGTDMRLTAHSLDGTSIYSAVDTLTLSSDSDSVIYYVIPSATGHEHKLNLTFVPKALALYGASKDSVHMVLPGAGGGSTPPAPQPPIIEVPGNPTDTPPGATPPIGSPELPQGGTGANPPTEPGHLVIISMPLDEQTRALLEQLRALLHSSHADVGERALALFSQAALPSMGSAVTLLPDGALVRAGEDQLYIASDALGATQPWSDGLAAPALSVIDQSSVMTMMLPPPNFIAPPSEAGRRNDAKMLIVPGVMNIDVSWAGDPTASDTPSSSAFQALDGATAELAIAGSVGALGNYIVERFSAEFSPGEQSLVLMVDPKPTRAAVSGRATAPESVTRGERLLAKSDLLAVGTLASG